MRRLRFIALGLCFYITNVSATDHHTSKGNNFPFYAHPIDTLKKAADTTKADSTDEEEVKHRKYEISLDGANDQSHYGLRNNVKIPYLEPSFTFTSKHGFYIETGDKDVLIKKKGGFDEFNLNPGWNFDVTDNTTLNTNFTFFHYKAGSSVLIKSNMWGTLEGYVDQYIGDLEGKLTIDYNLYSGKTTPNDIAFTPDICYNFEWDINKKSSLTVIPEVNLDIGTRNFYTQYQLAAATDSTKAGLKLKRKESSIPSNSSFGTLDYSVILSVEYKIGKFSIEPALTYDYPLYNPLGSTANPPLWLGSINLTYAIKSKK